MDLFYKTLAIVKKIAVVFSHDKNGLFDSSEAMDLYQQWSVEIMVTQIKLRSSSYSLYVTCIDDKCVC